MTFSTGFGNVWDGRPFWIGDFTGNGRADVLFYFPGDDNWWLGSFDANGQLSWDFAGNTAGFGHAINDGRPFWTGRFSRADRDEILFYFPGDDNWWLGTYDGANINWRLAGNTAGFGHAINDGRPFWIGDFTGNGRADVLFYFPGDGNWWLGTFDANGQLSWTLSGNSGRSYDAFIDINLMLTGVESFTAADFTEIDDMVRITRTIYDQVSLAIRNVTFFQITNAQAGAATTIDSESEASQLTSDWTVQNDALDVFIVRVMNGADGWSAVGGSCDKDSKGMNGSVVSLNGSSANSGNTLAHEMGHYLGLSHISDVGNFIGGGGSSDSWTGIHQWQGDTMKDHCFAHEG